MPAAPLFLIDGSSYVYRAFFALPPLTSPAGVPVNAVYGFSAMLLKLIRDATPEMLAIVFDAPGKTFRDTLYTEYKSQRPEAPPELAPQWPLVHQVAAAFRVRTLMIPDVEADDVIGTLAKRAAAAGIECVIATSDKDLMQLVGPHVRLWDTMRDRWTDEAAVRTRLGVGPELVADVMGLMGDPIDNIPGVRGIGEKTATALISQFGSFEGLMAHLDEVPLLKIRGARKVAELLREQAEQARLSRELALVRCDLPLDVQPGDLRFAGIDPAAARSLFQQLGFRSLARDLPAPRPTAAAPRDVAAPERLQPVINRLKAAGSLALATLDTASSAAGGFRGVIVAGLGVEPCAVPAEAALRERLAPLLEDAAVLKVGHDLKGDIEWLAALGVQLCGPLFDIMVASAMLAVSATHRLEDVCRELLGEEIEPFRGPAATIEITAAAVERFERLHEVLADRLRESDMQRLFVEVEMPLVEVLARMEQRGVLLDAGALREMGERWRRQLEALSEEIFRLAGGEFNINSPQQLREILFERLKLPSKGIRRGKTGLSTDVDVLTRLAAGHPLPAKILEYRSLAKLLSTYVDTLLDAVNPDTGRLHTAFNQTGAATGRLSSSEPNLQNIPIRGEEGRRIRSVFIPAPGNLFVAADYSQIELRIMAHLSEDPVLTASFMAGEDVHARTAAEIFGVLPGTITADMRRVAKVINFGIMYGMGPQRLASELGIPHAAAERYIEQYFQRYAGVRAYIERTIATGRETGYVSTMFGRRRLVPELRSPDRAITQAAERAAINMPIQGTAADLIKIAMVRIDRRLRDERRLGRMVLQVHDELLLEVPDNEAEAVEAIVRAEMEGAAPLRVPLAVDMGRGRTWAEAH